MVRDQETMNKIEIQLICVSETFSKGETDLSFGESPKPTTPNVSNCQNPFKQWKISKYHCVWVKVGIRVGVFERLVAFIGLWYF